MFTVIWFCLFLERKVRTKRSLKFCFQFKKRMDIFCSTSVRSRAVQNSWNEIIWSPSLSASTIVLSAMLTSCSSLENNKTFSREILLEKTKQNVISLLPDVVTNHHLKNTQQFFFGNLFVVVCVVHLKGKSEFAFPRIQLVLLVFLHWSKVGQHLHELLEIQLVFWTRLTEEGIDNTITWNQAKNQKKWKFEF